LAKQAREIFNKALIDAPAQKALANIADFLKYHSVSGYLVGGFVRDALLGRETADIDIAVGADVLEIGPQLADSLQGKFVLLDAIYRIGRIILPDWTIDVASFNGKIEDDLKRRDFTINAMAVDLQQLISEKQNTVLIDPFGGRLDLDLGIIKMVTATVFQDDPVRLLRAQRLAAELDFTIDRKAEAEIEKVAPLTQCLTWRAGFRRYGKAGIIDRFDSRAAAAKRCGAAERTSLGCFRAFPQDHQRRGFYPAPGSLGISKSGGINASAME
jgi:hypothetical protein